MNMDKLMNKLKRDTGADSDSPTAHKKRKRSGTDVRADGEGSSRRRGSNGIAEWGLGRKEKKPSTSMISGPKKLKGKKDQGKSVEHTTSMSSSTRTKSPPIGLANFTFKAKIPPASTELTAMQKDMKHSLDGARFR
jgi:hypothetical protein